MNTTETHVVTVVDATLDDVDGEDLPLASTNGAEQVVRAGVFEDIDGSVKGRVVGDNELADLANNDSVTRQMNETKLGHVHVRGKSC